jgi:hypothetical protein
VIVAAVSAAAAPEAIVVVIAVAVLLIQEAVAMIEIDPAVVNLMEIAVAASRKKQCFA